MRIAVEGCCHGELDTIYKTLEEADAQAGKKTDLLLICGDFQAVRYHGDLQSLAVPDKYRQLGDFHKYYSGEAKAPVLTIIIGGNHEASNYMFELFHGGWVAPSIYFLGYAGSVIVNGLKISGASGIYKAKDYKKGYFEALPYTSYTIRSIYHIREYNVVRLAMLARHRPDIFLSHDWPLGIEQHGDVATLKRTKPWFNAEIDRNELGSPPLYGLLKALKPAYWFAAHLHVKFAALFKHDGSPTTVLRPESSSRSCRHGEPVGEEGKVAVAVNPEEIALEVDDDAPPEAEDLASAKKAALAMLGSDAEEEEAPIALKAVPKSPVANEDEIVLDLDEEDQEEPQEKEAQPGAAVDSPPEPPSSTVAPAGPISNATKFLALSKCTPRRDFLQILEIETPETHDAPRMTFDPLWLAILRAFNGYMSSDESSSLNELPRDMAALNEMVDSSLDWVQQHVKQGGALAVDEVQTFTQTAPSTADYPDPMDPPRPFFNPQTQALCDLLTMDNRIHYDGLVR